MQGEMIGGSQSNAYNAFFDHNEAEIVASALLYERHLRDEQNQDEPMAPTVLTLLPENSGMNMIIPGGEAADYLDILSDAVNQYHVGLRTGRLPAGLTPCEDLRRTLFSAMQLSRQLGQVASDLRGEWTDEE